MINVLSLSVANVFTIVLPVMRVKINGAKWRRSQYDFSRSSSIVDGGQTAAGRFPAGYTGAEGCALIVDSD